MFSKSGNKFMVMPVDSVFNDYNLLFKLKSNIQYKSFSPPYSNEEEMQSDESKTMTMNLEGDKFHELVALYPETAENLKLRALEKRSIFMYYKNKADQKAQLGADPRRQIMSQQSSHRPHNSLLFKSTYSGHEDSDHDDFHITKPFKHSE